MYCTLYTVHCTFCKYTVGENQQKLCGQNSFLTRGGGGRWGRGERGAEGAEGERGRNSTISIVFLLLMVTKQTGKIDRKLGKDFEMLLKIILLRL